MQIRIAGKGSSDVHISQNCNGKVRKSVQVRYRDDLVVDGNISLWVEGVDRGHGDVHHRLCGEGAVGHEI